MDRDLQSYGAKAESASNGPENNVQNEISSLSTVSSRHSPITPLAPLEFLQNQRRGSITDPSLHAAGASSLPGINPTTLSSSSSKSRHPELPVHTAKSQLSPSSSVAEPSSAQLSESPSSPHLRRLLRSPSVEGSGGWQPRGVQDQNRSPTGRGGRGIERIERMDVDSQSPITLPKPDAPEHGGRRQSLAGTKRKKSPERGGQSSDIDPQLIGPGVGLNMDSEGPAPKRRSSAFDTRLEQLNLHDRRNSTDGRGQFGGGGSSQTWNSEKGEGSTPMFANTPLTAGYTAAPSSAFPADSPPGRAPPGIATFAWNQSGEQAQQTGSPQHHNEAAMANNVSAGYDPNPTMLPPTSTFPQDRRMSASNISPENMSPPSSSGGPTRAPKSRSRPSSRARAINPSNASGSTEQSPGPSSANTEDSPVTSSLLPPTPQRETGATPYSRSPELRVSHKLAERKRRREMKDLFDELLRQLPPERGTKQSKWEILSKAIEFISTLKANHQDMSREVEMLRHEVDGYRQGIPPFPPGGPVVYGHPPVGVPPFPHPAGPSVPPPPNHSHPPPSSMQNPSQPPLPRTGSSQHHYVPGPGSAQAHTQNGTTTPAEPRTDTPT